MSEGVQASPNPAIGGPQGLLPAIYPVVMGLIGAFGAWDLPASASLTRNILLGTSAVLIVVGIVIVVLRRVVQDPRDYYGGLALLALAMMAYWASSDLPGMHGFAFGPGTAPRLFAGVLGVLGAAVAAVGCFTEGPGLEKWALRGPFFITLATVIFAFTIRHFGLVIASFISICVSALGSSESKLYETLLWGAFLTAFCAVLFPIALNLPMPLWPQNLSFSASMFSIR